MIHTTAPIRLAFALATVTTAAIPGTAAATQTGARADSTPVVVTSGTGMVSLPPDRAVIFFAVQTRGRSAAVASQQNAATVRRVLDTLKTVVSQGDSVEVPAVSVSPVHGPEGRQISGYDATATVRVVLKNLDRLPRALDAGLNAGVTSLQGVNFESERLDAGRNEALARAFRQARASAEALSRAAGLALGPLLRVSSEGGGYEPTPMMMQMRMSAAETQLTPQNVVVQVTVQTTWRLTR